MADKKKNDSGSKRQHPSLEDAIRAEKEEIDQLEQEQQQEAQNAHALVRYHASCRSPPCAADRKGQDTWTEPLIALLLDLFALHYVPKRRVMSKAQWLDLSVLINKRIGNPSLHRTPSQVQGKINNLRKRYRRECQKGSSTWPFLQKMQDLFGALEGMDVAVSTPILAGPDDCDGDNRQGGVKKRKKTSNAGLEDGAGHNIQDGSHITSMNRPYAERSDKSEHGNSRFERTQGEPRGAHEVPHSERAGHPTLLHQELFTNQWLALAKAFDNFSHVYQQVELHKINAYTNLVTKLVDRQK